MQYSVVVREAEKGRKKEKKDSEKEEKGYTKGRRMAEEKERITSVYLDSPLDTCLNERWE